MQSTNLWKEHQQIKLMKWISLLCWRNTNLFCWNLTHSFKAQFLYNTLAINMYDMYTIANTARVYLRSILHQQSFVQKLTVKYIYFQKQNIPIPFSFLIEGTCGIVIPRCTAGQQSSDQSCTRGIIYNKIYLISQVVPGPA